MTSSTLLLLASTLMLSIALGVYLTPIVRRGAVRFGVLDQPDGNLKTHREPVAYLGGVAVYLAFLVTLSLVFDFEPHLLGLLLGGTMMVMLGLFDDLRVLPPSLKLAGQLIAAFVMIKSDIAIRIESIPPWLQVPLSVIWLVGITNAVNLLDVADGLAAGVTAIACAALGVSAWLGGDLTATVTAIALGGACLGFLRYNLPPARIFLGDAGSLFLGMMLGALSLIGRYTDNTPVGIASPLFILAVPILETTVLSTVRLRRGRSPFLGSADHLAHRLKRVGVRPLPLALSIYGAALIGAGLGLAVAIAPASIAEPLALSGAGLFAVALIAAWRLPGAPSV